jgi:multiple sugar transport system ATP-binding protein
MGIRPEDVSDVASTRAANQAVVKGTVNVFELLGAEAYLYFDLEGTQITARVGSGTTAKTGCIAEFILNIDKIHIFDKETERAVVN